MAIDISQKNVMYIEYNFDLASLGKDNLEEMISLLRVNGNLKGCYSQIDEFRGLKNELPTGVKFGTRYNTWCLNPYIWLGWRDNS
jgi:hypothetical protein